MPLPGGGTQSRCVYIPPLAHKVGNTPNRGPVKLVTKESEGICTILRDGKKPDAGKPAEKPVSLKPLKVEEALKGLLDTRPDEDAERSEGLKK